MLNWITEIKTKKSTVPPAVVVDTHFTPLATRLKKFIDGLTIALRTQPQSLEFSDRACAGDREGNLMPVS